MILSNDDIPMFPFNIWSQNAIGQSNVSDIVFFGVSSSVTVNWISEFVVGR